MKTIWNKKYSRVTVLYIYIYNIINSNFFKKKRIYYNIIVEEMQKNNNQPGGINPFFPRLDI